MPEHLVYRYCYGIREIKAAQFIAHGDTQTAFGIIMEQLFWKSLVLTSEYEVGVIRKFRVAVDLLSLGSEVEKATVLVFYEKIAEAVIVGYIELVPVVQTGAFELFVADLEAEGTDKMQPCARNSAGTGDVPGILRYLWFYKDDIQVLHISPFQKRNILFLDSDNNSVRTADNNYYGANDMNYRSLAKGAAAGAAVGIAFYALSSAGPMKKMSIKRDAGKALKAAGNLLDDIKSVIM